MRANIFLIILLNIVVFTPWAWADETDYNDIIRNAASHCPVNSEFAGVVVKPNPETGFNLLQCKNNSGNSYFSALNAIYVRNDDPSWLHIKYPESWICFGSQTEDCGFYQ
jgi:hypothetical protein